MYQSRNEECEVVERELRKLQDKHRDTIHNEYNLTTTRDHLEASLKIAQEEANSFGQQYEESAAMWKKERTDLQNKIHELIAGNERYRIETSKKVNNYSSKYTDYKNKLRKANSNMQTLAGRVAKYELQLAAEKDDKMSA